MKPYCYDCVLEHVGIVMCLKRIEKEYTEKLNLNRSEYNCMYVTASINNPTGLFSKKFVDSYVYYFMVDYINNSYGK